MIQVEDFDFDNILLDEKSYKNILIYDILYNTLTDVKPVCIRFDKVLDLLDYIFIMSHTRFRVNWHSIVAWMSRDSLLEAGA